MRQSLPLAQFAFEPILSTADGALHGLQFVYTGKGTYGYAPPPDHQAPEVEFLLDVLSEWQTIIPGLRLTIPATPPELASTELAARWVAAAKRAFVEPTSIELGLDPLFPPSPGGSFESNLAELREAGAGVVQMGFGLGHASMAMWSTISFTRIDLYSTFTDSPDEVSTNLLRSIAQVNASLNLPSTASGVSTEAQLQRVRSSGIELMRGPVVAPRVSGLGVRVWLSDYKSSRAAR